MNKMRIDLHRMLETRHQGSNGGRELGGGDTLMYKGVKVKGRRHGVAMVVGPKLIPYIQEVKLVTERLMSCTVNINGKKYHIYQIYAPQQGCTEEEKEQFMDVLEEN